ncbi:hypothetical protein HAX54_049745 [Datura stramonium]|uniref:Uncharacterized protein n=1 Tax=Datura stramonium TaxID=4076 RepID=A0ABS8WKQ0_DATST|nr:hypothetical protein [Datura stramonium]
MENEVILSSKSEDPMPVTRVLTMMMLFKHTLEGAGACLGASVAIQVTNANSEACFELIHARDDISQKHRLTPRRSDPKMKLQDFTEGVSPDHETWMLPIIAGCVAPGSRKADGLLGLYPGSALYKVTVALFTDL